MHELNIPTLINSGYSTRFLKRSFILLLLLALLLHVMIFAGLVYFNHLSFLFITIPEEKPILPEDSLNYVLVDDNLLDEEITVEKPKILGRVSRQSRDTVVNPDLPKLGPSSTDNSSVEAFDRGQPLPDSVPSPELTPTPPPVPQVAPQQPIQAIQPPVDQTPPAEQVPPVEQTTPVKQISTEDSADILEKEAVTVQPPEKKITPDLPELDLDDNLDRLIPKIKKDKPEEKEVKAADLPVPGITKSDSISKIAEKPVEPREMPKKPPQPEKPSPTQTPQKPVQPQKAIPTRKIPVRKIGSSGASSGGKIKKRLNSSAINTGSKSIAVLRSRYGEYMDKILRRIQQAIVIQQQINPISLHEGSVIMSFTIDADGYLSNIQYLDSRPQGITTEISTARSVLQDVHNGGAFQPPTPEMLNDPDFQKIIINFVFESM